MDLSNIDNKKLIQSILIAFFIWIIVVAAGFVFKDDLTKTIAPYYEWTINKLSPGYIHKVRLVEEKKDKSLWLTSTPLKPAIIVPDIKQPDGSIRPGITWPGGKTMPPTKVTPLHTFVPIVIFLTIVLSFPMESLKQRGLLWLLAVPGVLLITALTASIQMLGVLEYGFIEAAAQYNFIRDPSILLEWHKAMEGGGRWLLPILTALLLIYLVKAIIKE